MDARLRTRAEDLAAEIAGKATPIEELNGLLRLMMKSDPERMLDAEMDHHLGRRAGTLEEPATDSVLDQAFKTTDDTKKPRNHFAVLYERRMSELNSN